MKKFNSEQKWLTKEEQDNCTILDKIEANNIIDVYSKERLDWIKSLKVNDKIFYSTGKESYIERIFYNPELDKLNIIHTAHGDRFDILGRSGIYDYELYLLPSKPTIPFVREFSKEELFQYDYETEDRINAIKNKIGD